MCGWDRVGLRWACGSMATMALRPSTQYAQLPQTKTIVKTIVCMSPLQLYAHMVPGHMH